MKKRTQSEIKLAYDMEKILYDELVESRKKTKNFKRVIESNEYLYFILNNFNQVKIGKSIEPYSRMKNLGHSNGILKMEKVLQGCGKYENNIHAFLKEYNIKFKEKFDGYTEWFEYNSVVKSLIEDLTEDNIERFKYKTS